MEKQTLMATGTFAVFREENDPDEPNKQLLCVCVSRELALREIKARAEKYMKELDTLEPKSLYEEHDLRHRVQVGKLGGYPRYWVFFAEETELIDI